MLHLANFGLCATLERWIDKAKLDVRNRRLLAEVPAEKSFLKRFAAIEILARMIRRPQRVQPRLLFAELRWQQCRQREALAAPHWK